ncbi:hypothetical protein PIB30_065667 [Stylosanthes scabra]|uniref:glucan endo-1,3-beta-D-glucosidase n=1 Tax=Stylosanthes scabra TaxID=79078 RepID=A0ABU6WKH0_9FABA|nr:hypothetical protein [Stylosanthes scabra]
MKNSELFFIVNITISFQAKANPPFVPIGSTQKAVPKPRQFHIIIFVSIGVPLAAAQSIGICYGSIGSNLPSAQETVDLLKSNGIGRVRIYSPKPEIFEAFKGSNIELIVDAGEALQAIGSDPNAANAWVNTNIKPYAQDVKFKYIIVGNEVHPGDDVAQYVFPGMQNMHDALSSANLLDQIKVSTAIELSLLGQTYPPSAGAFNQNAIGYVQKIISFLVPNGSPFLANIYPYYAYSGDQQNVPLEYALFTQKDNNPVGYQNLFDAMLDATYAALEKIGGNDLTIVVAESGWPSSGGVGASIDNAGLYYQNLINHINVNGGTPMKPNQPIETYLFALFDEDQKPGPEIEKHFGLYNPDKSPKYSLSFK